MSSYIVAIYATHTAAEAAVEELQRSGFDMNKLSIVGRDFHTDENIVGYYTTNDRMKAWGKRGAFWGGIWGLLVGSAFFAVPGIGPVLMAGPFVSWVVGAIEGATVVGGLSIIGAALVSIGIPKGSVLLYETAIKTDKFVLVAEVSAVETVRTKAILDRTNAFSLKLHP